jgi:hypothetical protein
VAIEKTVDSATKAGKSAEEIAKVREEATKSERLAIELVDLGLLLTIAYFAFFLVLPLLGRIERPLPVPESIAKAVLAKNGGRKGPAPAGAPAR